VSQLTLAERAAELQFPPNPPAWAVSYNSTELDPGPTGTTLSFMEAPVAVDPNTCAALGWRPFVLEQSVPICPTLPYSAGGTEYWGDYDDLTVLSVDQSGVTTFIRSHTDSTSQCTHRDKHWATPMHVSADTFQ
jgi:hypothetical protein